MEKKKWLEMFIEIYNVDSKDVLTSSVELGENETPILPLDAEFVIFK